MLCANSIPVQVSLIQLKIAFTLNKHSAIYVLQIVLMTHSKMQNNAASRPNMSSKVLLEMLYVKFASNDMLFGVKAH